MIKAVDALISARMRTLKESLANLQAHRDTLQSRIDETDSSIKRTTDELAELEQERAKR